MLSTGHVIVCGLEHLGLRTIDELRMRDEEVVGIGPNDDAAERLAAAGVRLVVGDARLSRVLSQADVETAGAIVLTGDDDLANLNAALAAVELNPRIRTVIRMFDQELGSHIPELLPDAVALSSSALAAPGFVSAAIDGESGTRFRLGGRLVMSRESADPARAPLSIPIARLRADRSVEILPDAPTTDPNLILIDIAATDTDGVDPDPAPAPGPRGTAGASEPDPSRRCAPASVPPSSGCSASRRSWSCSQSGRRSSSRSSRGSRHSTPCRTRSRC